MMNKFFWSHQGKATTVPSMNWNLMGVSKKKGGLAGLGT
jgi:hypothetical protein